MFGPDIFVAPKMTRDLLYDDEDPDEMFGNSKHFNRGQYNSLVVVLPGGPEIVGG